MQVILFDPKERSNFFPLAFTRPVAAIKVGYFTIAQKWSYLTTASISFLTVDYLSKKYQANNSLSAIYVDGSLIPDIEIVSVIAKMEFGDAIYKEDRLIAFYGQVAELSQIWDLNLPLSRKIEYQPFLKRIAYTWDLVTLLDEELRADIVSVSENRLFTEVPEHVTVFGKGHIYIEEGAILETCTLNTTNGSVYIASGATVMDGAILRGPIAIGSKSVVKMGAKLYGPVAIGNGCTIGGELNHVSMFGYSNKGHDGFLGHSVIGEWCNLGADTNNSNLKNNYEPVRMWSYTTERFERTGLQFLGLIMADHSKTGINTMLNTGTVIGVASNVYGAGFPRNFIPSFSDGGAHGFKLFDLKKVYGMAKRMMERRNWEFDEIEQQIVESVFELTRKYRKFN